jgi:hypothetical protein
MKLSLDQAVRPAGTHLGNRCIDGGLFASRVDDAGPGKVPAYHRGIPFDLRRLANQNGHRKPGCQRVARGLQNWAANGAHKRHRARFGTGRQRQEFRRAGGVGRCQERACDWRCGSCHSGLPHPLRVWA